MVVGRKRALHGAQLSTNKHHGLPCATNAFCPPLDQNDLPLVYWYNRKAVYTLAGQRELLPRFLRLCY